MAVENDLVLIFHENEPLSFARIETIAPDAKRDWYQVQLLMLQMPVTVVTWILRSEYIDGAEFTMNGRKMRIEPVISPARQQASPPEAAPAPKTGPNVISIDRFRKS